MSFIRNAFYVIFLCGASSATGNTREANDLTLSIWVEPPPFSGVPPAKTLKDAAGSPYFLWVDGREVSKLNFGEQRIILNNKSKSIEMRNLTMFGSDVIASNKLDIYNRSNKGVLRIRCFLPKFFGKYRCSIS